MQVNENSMSDKMINRHNMLLRITKPTSHKPKSKSLSGEALPLDSANMSPAESFLCGRKERLCRRLGAAKQLLKILSVKSAANRHHF